MDTICIYSVHIEFKPNLAIGGISQFLVSFFIVRVIGEEILDLRSLLVTSLKFTQLKDTVLRYHRPRSHFSFWSLAENSKETVQINFAREQKILPTTSRLCSKCKSLISHTFS